MPWGAAIHGRLPHGGALRPERPVSGRGRHRGARGGFQAGVGAARQPVWGNWQQGERLPHALPAPCMHACSAQEVASVTVPAEAAELTLKTMKDVMQRGCLCT